MHAHHHNGEGSPGAHREQNRRRLTWTLVLAAGYMVAEAVGGVLTGSLALLADAGHMASDVGALGLALFATWMAARPATPQRTYGHTRAEVLAALAQGAALVAVAILIVVEAVERLQAPTPVMGGGMLLIATGGLVVNLLGLWILSAGRSDSLNMRGAWLHVLSDALGSVGAIAAGAAIWAFGWTWADSAASIAICALILLSAWTLLREAVDVLMETAPRHLDVDEIRAALAELPDVVQVHDLHVWSIGSGEISLSSHLVAKEGAEPAELLNTVYEVLGGRFGIDHATIQIEPPRFATLSPRNVANEGCPADCEASALPRESD
ncbi:MAG: cation diffusion facilitator family transporter [Proteobacteria bacterium]|nr:cation diffusion facilitator family transporter [Pseudomonadota bacterium]